MADAITLKSLGRTARRLVFEGRYSPIDIRAAPHREHAAEGLVSIGILERSRTKGIYHLTDAGRELFNGEEAGR